MKEIKVSPVLITGEAICSCIPCCDCPIDQYEKGTPECQGFLEYYVKKNGLKLVISDD